MRVMFLYLGRRGALGQFTLELAEAASQRADLEAEFVISSSNKLAPQFSRFASSVLCLDTFEKATPVAVIKNYFRARRELLAELKRNRPVAVVTLMPHVWTPLLAPEIQKLGIRYISVIHDVIPHPGDATAALTKWLRREARIADVVVTLSRTVADRLLTIEHIPPERILPLFHPNLQFGCALANRMRNAKRPLRLLFFGRIMKYKGLPILIEALELLKAEGVEVQLGVAGEGNIARERSQLAALGAEVINRWVEEGEVGALLARYDALVLSHIEASQSGVIATAHGNCMPVVGMPVGGIAEQIITSHTGVLASRVSARALADAIKLLAVDAQLYEKISAHLSVSTQRSMARFVDEIVGEVGRLNARREGPATTLWKAEQIFDAPVPGDVVPISGQHAVSHRSRDKHGG